MSHKHTTTRILAFVVGLSPLAQAQLHWDTNPLVSGLQGGAGIWSTGAANWNASSDGTTLATGNWVNGTAAVFDSAGTYTVTPSGTPQASDITILQGTLTFSGGTVQLNAGGKLLLETGAGAVGFSTITLPTGTSTYENKSPNLLTVSTLQRNTGANANVVFDGSGNITVGALNNIGTGSITKNGAGTLTIQGRGNQVSQAVTVNGGVLNVTTSTHLTTRTTATALTLNNGTLRTDDDRPTGISDAAHGITLGASGGTMEQTGATVFTQDGVITGTGALTKAGTGTLQLNNANNYAGNTTVSEGTLAFGSGGSVASPTIAIGASGTLDTSAVASYTLTPGKAITSAGTLTGSPTFTVTGGSFTQTAGSWTTDLFHANGSGGSVSVADLAAAPSGGKELRYTIDAGGATTINLTDNNPFGAYSGAAQWKSRWEISVIGNLTPELYPSSILLMDSSLGGYDLALLAGTGLTINAKNNLNVDTTFTDVANGDKIWLGGGAGQAQYQVNFSNDSFSLDLVVGSARAIPEPGSLGLIAMGLALLRWKLRGKRSVER